MPSRPRGGELGRLLRRLPLAVLAAVAVWLALKGPYGAALCAVTQSVARAVEVPRAAMVTRDGDHAILGRTDLHADSGRLRISLIQIHFNLIPFLALVLATPGALSRRGVQQMLMALAILALSHLVGLFLHLRFFYAFQLGAWSEAQYSNLAREVWGGLRHFFRLPVTFCLPLLLWVGAFPEQVRSLLGFEAE